MADTIIYVILMLFSLYTIIMRPELGTFISTIMASITGCFLGLRALYFGKSAWENTLKIKQNVSKIISCDNENIDNDDSLG